jgi:hypothetical protein
MRTRLSTGEASYASDTRAEGVVSDLKWQLLLRGRPQVDHFACLRLGLNNPDHLTQLIKTHSPPFVAILF